MASEPNNNSTTTPNGNSDTTSSTLTLRMIMQGKEAGSIIGKKGDNVKKFREESGAKINISDSSCPERIVTVTGTTDQIFKAFNMICKKFEDDIETAHQLHCNSMLQDIQSSHQNSTLPKPPVTVRLIIPASQCGSLIGKGGSKIKEIREVTGASIQVASEMLPNSTERAVTISGTADAITQCIYHICCVMIESPPKGATIPYRPKPAVPPVIFAGGQAFTVQGQYIPQPDPRGPGMVQFTPPPPQPHLAQLSNMSKMPLQHHGMAGLPPGHTMQLMGAPGIIPATSLAQGMAGAPFPRPHLQGPPNHTQTHEMTIPNDLIGCIIGRGGAKINEIRQLSGATIKIANADEGSSDRKVTIMGTPETINAAQYLINASLEMHKQLNPDLAAAAAAAAAGNVVSSSPTPTLMAPGGMAALSHAALGPLHPLKAMPFMAMQHAGPQPLFDQMAAKSLTTKLKGPGMGSPNTANAAMVQVQSAAKKNGNKFSPY